MAKHKKKIKISTEKKRVTIKLPPKFKNFITDKKMQEEFVKFAQDKTASRPSFGELTSFADTWMTEITGRKYNADDISLDTYKLMRKDAQLQLGLKVIKLPIKAMKWWVVSDDKDIRRFVEFALKRVWKSVMTNILNALDFGWSACEKIWEVKDVHITRRDGNKMVTAYKGQAVLLKKLKDPDPSSVTILTDDDGNFNGFEQKIGGSPAVIVPAEKSFIFTNEKEFGNLYGKSLLRYAYDYWYWATLMYQFLNRYFERRGTPPVIARAPAGRTNLSDGTIIDNLTLAQKAGESLTENSVVALPSVADDRGVRKWDLDYLKDDQRADMFMRYIEHLNVMKLRALFVPERAVIQDGEMGAMAVAKTHLSVFLMGLEGLTQDIVDHFNKYLIPQLIQYNFGENVATATIETSGLSSESKNLLKQIVVTTIKKGDGNIPLDMIKALEELNLPIDENWMDTKQKEEDDDGVNKDKKDTDKKIGDKDANTEAKKGTNDLRKEYRLSEIRTILELE